MFANALLWATLGFCCVHSKLVTVSTHDSPNATTTDVVQSMPSSPGVPQRENLGMMEFIETFTADMADLDRYYRVSFSRTRYTRLREYLQGKKDALESDFDLTGANVAGRADWLLMNNYNERQLAQVESDWQGVQDMRPLLGDWALNLVDLVEKRDRVAPFQAEQVAGILSNSSQAIVNLTENISSGEFNSTSEVDQFTAYRATQAIVELQSHMLEWYEFYINYDPMFTWWVSQPWKEFHPSKLDELTAAIESHLVGIEAGDTDAIVGQPSGRESLMADLEAEMIAYTPEELIEIGEQEYDWCETEMIKASRDLGYGDDWLAALDYAKTLSVPPGQQPRLVHELAAEAVEFVSSRDMITIPPLADETWRTLMMSPERQLVNPFFLGGTNIIVSFPTNNMTHAEKQVSLQANARPFARSTVFHELVPGHHLQYYYMPRFKPYRQLFETPFWIEGWAFYWEMLLWDRDFAGTPEEKIGMLFWRMHRASRIIFSLKFHLGEMTAQECIDFLVEKGGHERGTAEGEVRRSFNGDYTPLYQAGYALGALQIYALRREVVDNGDMSEKEFHDRVMKENSIPIEILRALVKDEKLDAGYKPSWKFYDS